MDASRRFEPHDRTALEQIRDFETRQPNVTAPTVSEHIGVLQMSQTIVLNLTAAALRSRRISDEDTPTLFLPHTVTDDLRQAELNLILGYVVAVAHAMRDALEATALCALMSRFPERAKSYFEGAENTASQVRKDLETAGLNEGVLASLWFQYEFLSQITHPNMERLALVMDERSDPTGGVVRTYNAGGTNNPQRLLFIGDLCVSCVPAILLLITDSLSRYLDAAELKAVRASTRDVTARVRPLVLRLRPKSNSVDPDATAYAARLRRRFAKQQETMASALAKMEAESASPGG